MTTATRQEVLGLYRSIFRLARKWRAASGQMEDTVKEKQYILSEARTLFQKNKNVSRAHLEVARSRESSWGICSFLSYLNWRRLIQLPELGRVHHAAWVGLPVQPTPRKSSPASVSLFWMNQVSVQPVNSLASSEDAVSQVTEVMPVRAGPHIQMASHSQRWYAVKCFFSIQKPIKAFWL